jgi:hypothetical protein
VVLCIKYSAIPGIVCPSNANKMLTINPLNKIDLFFIFIKFEFEFVVDPEGF